jgi:hypothetical protein
MPRHVDTTNWRVPKHPGLVLWRAASRWSARGALVACVVWWYGSIRSVVLPDPRALRPEVLRTPVQSSTEMPEFLFTWEGVDYEVTPRAEYMLAGVVVTHNNVGGIGDIYHDANAVDLRDLCVMWGESAKEGRYLHGEFWSAPWQCFYQPARNTIPAALDEFSNNHMLSGSKAITEKIRATRIGDQVLVKGFLVEYRQAGSASAPRGTSLVRDDVGDGACEVVFATEFTLLERANPGWRRVETISWTCMWGLAVFCFGSWMVLPYLSYRWE